jgi:predicted ATPase
VLTELRLKNVKALADVAVPLSRFTIIVGANGSGKSTVLRAVDDLSRVLKRARSGSKSPVEDVFAGSQGYSAIKTLGSREGDVVHELTASEPGVTVRIRQRDFMDDEPWRIDVERASGSTVVTNAGQLQSESVRGDLNQLTAAIRLQLSAERLAAAVPATEATPRLRPDGFGLSDLLAWIASSDPERREAIERDLRAVVPAAQRYRVTRVKTVEQFEDDIVIDGKTIGRTKSREVVANRIEVEIANAGWVSADHLSEGTLVALGLVTALRTQTPRVLLLDDLDRALHPRAQRDLVAVLKSALAQPGNANLQVIATTHSPFIVDAVDAEDVRVLSLGPQGHARCKKLTDHPDWEKWRDQLKAGEFWSFVGEEWLFGSGT